MNHHTYSMEERYGDVDPQFYPCEKCGDILHESEALDASDIGFGGTVCETCYLQLRQAIRP
jgi:hypothetical protein